MIRIFSLVFSVVIAFAAQAQTDNRRPSAEEIVTRLKPANVKTRALGNIENRGLKREDAGASSSGQNSTIDLEVNFEYASAELSTDARQVLDNLGKALTDPALKSSRFQVAGHTDAAGGEGYNIALSKRRAQAVADYLKNEYGVETARLRITGFGATQLLDTVNPLNAINRRVQVVNLGAM
ncbi:MAG: OmpA family protein [Hylemonella sp.]|nr:OmpA family protein [Hylemonella sp.]